jgi:hypothetical protein
MGAVTMQGGARYLFRAGTVNANGDHRTSAGLDRARCFAGLSAATLSRSVHFGDSATERGFGRRFRYPRMKSKTGVLRVPHAADRQHAFQNAWAAAGKGALHA